MAVNCSQSVCLLQSAALRDYLNLCIQPVFRILKHECLNDEGSLETLERVFHLNKRFQAHECTELAIVDLVLMLSKKIIE